MLSRTIKTILRYKLVIGFALLAVLLVLQLNWYGKIEDYIPSEERSYSLWIILGITITSLSLLLYLMFMDIQPLRKLNEKVKHIAEKDFKSLIGALTEFSHGNLTAKLTVDSAPIKITASENLQNLTENMNSIITQMQEAAKEFNSATYKPCQRLFYVGADSYIEGRTCGEFIGKSLNGKGKVAVLTRNFSITGLELRRKGFQNVLREKFPSIDVVDVSETTDDKEVGLQRTIDVIKKHPDLNGIYITFTGGDLLGKAIENLHKEEKIISISHDLTNDTIKYIQKGSLTATLGQDVYAQGHDPAIHLFNHIVNRWKPQQSRMLTINDVVTKENCNQFWQLGKGLVESEVTISRRPKPAAKSPRPVKIAFLGIKRNEFWDLLQSFVEAASRELREFNGSVEWILPEGYEKDGKLDLSAKVFGPAIKKLVQQKYNAIVTGIFDQNLVPFINDAVSAGIPVASYNSEPISFRDLFSSLVQKTKELYDISKELGNSVDSTLEASHYNASAINQITSCLRQEADSINKTTENVQSISSEIENISQGAYEQQKAAKNVSNACEEIYQAIKTANDNANLISKASLSSIEVAQNGAASVMNTIERINKIQKEFLAFFENIKELNSLSENIGEIVNTIDDIAEQTNLLALNASIEAARAGESGRGFAVVADEVKVLADRSAKATNETSSLIQKVQKNIEASSKAIEELINEIKEGNELANNSGKSIEQLLANSNEMNEKIGSMVEANTNATKVTREMLHLFEGIATITDRHKKSTDEVKENIKHTLGMIMNITEISNTNASTIEDIARKTDNTHSQTENINHVAFSLSNMAKELQGVIAQFNIEEKNGYK